MIEIIELFFADKRERRRVAGTARMDGVGRFCSRPVGRRAQSTATRGRAERPRGEVAISDGGDSRVFTGHEGDLLQTRFRRGASRDRQIAPQDIVSHAATRENL
jgi:hypothetical protein